MGKKKQPFYRIVAIDSRKARNGRFLETVGTYNPITKPARVELHEDLITKWLNDGAIPSDTVASLMTQVGFTEKYHRAQKGEDVSGIEIKKEITERKKRTKKLKKAAVAAEEAEKKAAEEKEAAAKAEAEAAEAPAEEAKADEGGDAEEKPAE
jgi:small subunit ribosomal protein S16